MLGWSGMLDVLQSEASNAEPTGNILQLFSESDQDSQKNPQDVKRQSWFKWSFQSSMSTRSIFSQMSGHSMRVESTHTSEEL